MSEVSSRASLRLATDRDDIDAHGDPVVGGRARRQADQLAVQLLEASKITELERPPETVPLTVRRNAVNGQPAVLW